MTALVARGVGVRYGATTALADIDLELRPGEVHAVVGENGAGKSTLLRVLAGAVRHTGTIDTAVQHLAWVPQDARLPPDLTVTEWLFLGAELCGPLGWLRRRAMREATVATLGHLGAHIAADARVGTLTAPQGKQVQLARAVRNRPDVLLLDEPTAVLGEAETAQLFRVVRELKAAGTGVLYVSHRLDEVLAIADRVTVLRDGRRVSTDPVRAVDSATVIQRMVGREIPAHTRAERRLGEVVLQVTDLAAGHVRRVSLSVRRGEVVGLAGLVGAGRSEVLEALAGVRRLRGGTIARHAPAAFVPEDRGRNGLVPTLSVRENLFLPAPSRWLRARRERLELARWMNRLHIRARSTETAIDSLSGGNQQKLLLARALRRQPELLLLDEPTAGVDVGAKAEIHACIRQLAADGAGIVLASSDLPELLLLCDRIVALRGGRPVGELAAAVASEPRLAALITGAAPRRRRSR